MFIRNLKSLFIVLIFGLINNCGPVPLPEWYLNPPSASSSKLYGVGYGSDLKAAQDSALTALAQSISVNISSSMEILKQETSNSISSSFSESAKQSIKSQVEQISFTNFKNEKSVSIGKDIYSLVSVLRSDLIDDYLNKLKEKESKIDNIFRILRNKTLIEQKAYFLQIQNIIKESNRDIVILRAITNNNKYISPFIEKFKSMDAAHQIINDQLFVYINYDANSVKIAEAIKEKLSEENIKINNVKSLSRNEAVIKINSEQSRKDLYGLYLIKNEVNLAILSNKNKLIHSNSFTVNASSSLGFNEAETSMAKKLLNEMQNINFFEFINFNKL